MRPTHTSEAFHFMSKSTTFQCERNFPASGDSAPSAVRSVAAVNGIKPNDRGTYASVDLKEAKTLLDELG